MVSRLNEVHSLNIQGYIRFVGCNNALIDQRSGYIKYAQRFSCGETAHVQQSVANPCFNGFR